MMSAEENKAFILRYLAAINGHPKTEALCDLFMTDFSLKQHILAAETGFPLYSIKPREIIAEGDLVCVQGKVCGVHQGVFNGIPATGKAVEFDIFITYRVADGKIIDHWMLTDNLTALQQMGVLPMPQTA
jgi:hypothetical protein